MSVRVGEVAPRARRVFASFAGAQSAVWSLAAAVVAVVWIVAMAQWIAGDLVVPWDSKNQFYAFYRFLASALHGAGTPFWNPFHYAGHPSLADPQSLILSPPFLIWALFDPAPSLRAFDMLVFAHLLVGGAAMVLYGRRHDWSPPAAVLAAIVFMFGGPVAGRAEHVGIITVYALFPLALLLFEIAFERNSLPAAIGSAVTASLIALGRNHASLLLCALLASFAIRHVIVTGQPWAALKSRAATLAVMATVVFAIVAVPMLLTIQFAAFSNRPQEVLKTALMSSLYPVNLANFFVPDVFGTLLPMGSGQWGPGDITRPGLDWTEASYDYLFAGSLTALLIAWFGLACGRATVPSRRFLAATAIMALLYAFGRSTPLYSILFDTVPGVDLFRRPVDATFIVILLASLFAGHLLSDYIKDGLPRLRRWPLMLTVVGVAALLCWAVEFSTISSKGFAATLEIAKAAPIYFALIALLMLSRTPRARLAAACIAVTFTAGELVARNAAASINAEPRSYYALLEHPAPDDARILRIVEKAVARDRSPTVRPRIEVVGLGGPWQNAAMVFGLEATNGYNPMRIGPYDLLVSPGEAPWTTQNRLFPPSFPRYDSLLGRELGLEFVVLDRPIEKLPKLFAKPDAELIAPGPPAWIYRLRHITPRVALDGVVHVADASRFIKAARYLPSVSPSEVWIDGHDKLAQNYAGRGPATAGKAAITSWRPDRVEISVDAKGAAILTLHDLWYPGWEVEVDGKPRPLLRADVLFRGVEVPAGSHRVVFTFRPLSWKNLSAAFATMLGAPVR